MTARLSLPTIGFVPLRRYALAAEAAASLIAARAGLRVVPFRRVAAWTTRPVGGRVISDRARTRAIADVRWAIAAAGARLPGATLCFPRALAAQAMLRRRGVASALTYGTRRRGNALDAHVWVTAGDVIVIGEDVASDYVPVVTYSNDAPVAERSRA